MPDFQFPLTDPRVNRSDSFSVGWVLVGGGRYSTNISGLGGDRVIEFPGEQSAARAAIGDMSNAGLIRMSFEENTFIAIANALTLDESYSDGIVAVVVFQNNNGEEISFEIPNPDLSVFSSVDRVTMLAPVDGGTAGEQLVFNMADSVATLINNTYTPANSFAFVRGFRASRKIKTTRAKTMPTIAEPTGGVNPPDAPAT